MDTLPLEMMAMAWPTLIHVSLDMWEISMQYDPSIKSTVGQQGNPGRKCHAPWEEFRTNGGDVAGDGRRETRYNSTFGLCD